jgi:hypothetical protein
MNGFLVVYALRRLWSYDCKIDKRKKRYGSFDDYSFERLTLCDSKGTRVALQATKETRIASFINSCL